MLSRLRRPAGPHKVSSSKPSHGEAQSRQPRRMEICRPCRCSRSILKSRVTAAILLDTPRLLQTELSGKTPQGDPKHPSSHTPHFLPSCLLRVFRREFCCARSPPCQSFPPATFPPEGACISPPRSGAVRERLGMYYVRCTEAVWNQRGKAGDSSVFLPSPSRA